MFLRILVCYLLVLRVAFAADWELVPGANGAASVRWHTLPVVEMVHVAWGAKWSWAPVKVRQVGGILSGNIAKLNATLSGTAAPPTPPEVSAQWAGSAQRPSPPTQ